MKTMQQWYDDYAVSHQNETNQKIHYFCVPAIFFSIVGMLMSIPTTFLNRITGLEDPLWINWASLIMLLLLIFYLRLSFAVFLRMLGFCVLCLYGNFYLGQIAPLFATSLIIFVVAWIGQFYGHKVEGKKPSFFKDLQFLLIGPAWVFEKLSR
ncbi:DUF962 domain-containing protein [Lutimonas zeaxanthinifaciens]|uniref:Mpo1 family 2-hydroxy fatty acid dioxygenase n=1 Tax=Lutimonas zeaxanthinifaciens TaxID=3060215 RepID=UPI00265C9CEB|nr:Mpo1-like protein [Lutimonas sp. YSD2104]WKK67312.1 DUF962 domain-containing protein [Lutimonas sp. YSD2104]